MNKFIRRDMSSNESGETERESESDTQSCVYLMSAYELHHI